jgi:ubiquinone/menaquinone biosynthesis C-methylase UbiE
VKADFLGGNLMALPLSHPRWNQTSDIASVSRWSVCRADFSSGVVSNAVVFREPVSPRAPSTIGRLTRWGTVLITLLITLVGALAAQPLAAEIPPPLREYKGRVIAQTMHYSGAEWLIRDEREREERCSLMLANLGVKRGMTICDMGCGNGFYALQLAPMVGPRGRILAVDIQPQMLYLLRERMESDGVENITPILGSLHDPRIPEGSVDLMLLVDVYHEFSHPEQMLAAIRRSLSPDGLVALVEFRAEDDTVPIRPEHKMSKDQIMKEFPPNGFKLVKEFDRLPWQHMMFFARDESE